jgi:hypothetical protein
LQGLDTSSSDPRREEERVSTGSPRPQADSTELWTERAALAEADPACDGELSTLETLETPRTCTSRGKRKFIALFYGGITLTAVMLGSILATTKDRPQPPEGSPMTVGAPAPPPIPSPSSSPASQLHELFRSTLPPYTLESLRNTSSPQHKAFEWATETDRVPWMEAPSNETLRLARTKQRFALATLHYATGGPRAWLNSSGWLNATRSECEWFGCSCRAPDWRVDGISLEGNGLTGSLPPETSLMPLTTFTLSKNHLRGPIPKDLSQFSALARLDLSSNLLSSSLPSQLGRLSDLKFVSLASNALSGPIPSELGLLQKLLRLSVSDNKLNSTIPTELGLLSSTRSLNLRSNDLSGSIPTQLGQISALTDLDLSSNRLRGTIPSELGLLTRLSSLDLSDNGLTGTVPPELDRLPDGAVVDVSSNMLAKDDEEAEDGSGGA